MKQRKWPGPARGLQPKRHLDLGRGERPEGQKWVQAEQDRLHLQGHLCHRRLGVTGDKQAVAVERGQPAVHPGVDDCARSPGGH